MTYIGPVYSTGDFVEASESLPPYDKLLDCWSFYDFKPKFLRPATGLWGTHIPSWVPPMHHRRIRAYELLEAFYKLCARRWINAPWQEALDRREYGDPYLIVEAVLSSVMGSSQDIFIEGAAGDSPDPQAVKVDALLDQWADDENLELKLTEGERNAVKYGDGVFTIGWDNKRKRPRLRVWDPGFYFPVEDPLSDEDYPEKVHIAYEFEDPTDPYVGDAKKKFVRRITWELVEVPAYTVPWSPIPVTENCLYSDMVWELGSTRGPVEDFDLSKADIRADNVPLGIDFIPVVHIPNMSLEGYLWGVSCLAPVIQLLDDIVSTDTDLQATSALTGSPIMGVSGTSLPRDADGKIQRYGPGEVMELGMEGKLDYLDTSHSLDALLKLQKENLDRMSVNGRVPASLIGRIEPGRVHSGVILTLSYAPHTTMIREMRRIRKAKYRLLMKFVTRMFMQDGQITGDIPNVELKFGSYLPADKQETSGIVTALRNAAAMSMETAVQMLVEAGYPIEDAIIEIQRIREQDYIGATRLTDATMNQDFAIKYLNLGSIQSDEASEGEVKKSTVDLNEAKAKQAERPPPEPTTPFGGGGNQPGQPNQPQPSGNGSGGD